MFRFCTLRQSFRFCALIPRGRLSDLRRSALSFSDFEPLLEEFFLLRFEVFVYFVEFLLGQVLVNLLRFVKGAFVFVFL